MNSLKVNIEKEYFNKNLFYKNQYNLILRIRQGGDGIDTLSVY